MLTMHALLANRALELRLLVPGPPGALDAEVLWVHNTELLNPLPYLRERELVLTNGLWRTDPDASAAFVAHVTRAKAAGIVFGLREETPRTPPDLIEACQQANLPLLEISVRVPFTAVSQAAAAAYAERRQQALLTVVRRGSALADAISRGAGASGVLRVLRRDYDLPLAVVDRMGRLLATAGADLTPAQRDTVAAALTRRPPPLEADLGPAGPAALFLVGAIGDTDAALVCLRPVTALTTVEREALEQAARFLSLEVAKQQAVQAIEMRFAAELLDMILSGPQRAAEVPGRLQAFGIDAAGPLAACALAFADCESPTLPGIAERVGEFFVTEGTPVVVSSGSQDTVAILAWRHPEPELPGMAQRLVAAVRPRFPGYRLVVGLGSIAANASGLRRSLVEAREACRLLRRQPGSPTVACFAELGTHRLLLGLHDRETLQRFAASMLGPVRAHDRARGGQLERSLRAFLDHDGRWAAAAAALHVHVNTLRLRLARVAELTGRDVNRTADRVDLFLALEADQLQ